MPKTILILPDSHAKPGVSNERYDTLAQFIIARRPDVVVDLGDFADMESLSSYDKGKLSGQNRHVGNDIDVAVNARQRLTRPILAASQKTITNHRHRWIPRLVALGGNHEERVDRYINDHPELLGVLNQDVSKAAEAGWEWHPFMEKVLIEGVTFCHYFHNHIGKPYSGVNPGRTLIQKLYTSCVAGHSHVWNHYSDVDATGRRIHGLVAGCYFGHEEAYARHSNAVWDRCITVLHEVHNGNYSVEKVSYEYIQKFYSVEGLAGKRPRR